MSAALDKYSDESLFQTSEEYEQNRAALESKILGSFTTDQHTPLRAYRKNLHPNFYKNCFKFCVVRNPWERMISYYHWKKQKQSGMPNDEFNESAFKLLVQNQPGMETYLVDRKMYLNKALGVLINPFDMSPIDYYLKYENLEEDFAKLITKLGIHHEGANLNRIGKTHRKHYRHYYSEEMAEFVAKRFKNEIEYFGYKF